MNEYDSSKMADLLDTTHGYQLTENAKEADVLLLNTCSIREKHRKKFSCVRPLEASQTEKSGPDYWRGWLRRIAGR